MKDIKNGIEAVYILKIGKKGYYIGMSKELDTRIKKHKWELKNKKKMFTWYKHYKTEEDFQVVRVYYFDTRQEAKDFENVQIAKARKAEKTGDFVLLNYQDSNKLSGMTERKRKFIQDYYAKKNENKYTR